MLQWIGAAAAAALLTALMPVFVKAGSRTTAPAIGAWLFSFAVLAVSLGTLVLSGTAASLQALSAQQLLLLGLSGLTTGCLWLCLFRALAGGLVNRVMPVYSLYTLLALVGGILFFEGRIWLWRACFIVLVLIGTVLIESRQQRAKSAAWLLFAALCAVFAALSELFDRLGLALLPHPAAMTLRSAVAFVFLSVVSASGRSFGTIRSMRAGGWCFTLLAGLCAGGAVLCRFFSEQAGVWTELSPVTCLILPLTLLLSRICLRERMPGPATLGLILTALGNFALLMNF